MLPAMKHRPWPAWQRNHDPRLLSRAPPSSLNSVVTPKNLTTITRSLRNSLFTADTHFVVYMNAKDPKPSQEVHSREALAPVFADLNKYAATTHFLGQSTIPTPTGDQGTGETYCMPHQLTIDGGKRQLMIATLRYHDTFAKMDGAWLFAERLLYVDWIEERILS